MDEAVAALGEPTYTLMLRGRRVALYCCDCASLLQIAFAVDLILTSPPYNIGKAYAASSDMRSDYFAWLRDVVDAMGARIRRHGSVWLNVGHTSDRVPIAYRLWNASARLQLHQEVIWAFSRGVAAKHYFSPRHETLLWFSRAGEPARFELDRVREPHDQRTCTCGTRNGKKRCNPNGKNPGDVWHVQTVAAGAGRAAKERQPHPAQMPLEIAARIVAGCGGEGLLLLDPFCGSGTSLVAAVTHGMDAIGIDVSREYVDLCKARLEAL